MEQAKIKRTDLLWLSPNDLEVEDGFNVRFDYGNIEELAESIAQHGVRNPIRASKNKDTGKYILTDGHRRFKAIQLLLSQGRAGDLLVPTLPDGKGTSEESRTIALITHNEGKRLNLLEEACVYKRLIDFGHSQADIARLVSKSEQHISNCLLLMTAPKSLKDLIMEGKVSPSLVIENMKNKSATKVVEEVEDALSKGVDKVTKKHIVRAPSVTQVFTMLGTAKNLSGPTEKAIETIKKFLSGSLTKDEAVRQLEEI